MTPRFCPWYPLAEAAHAAPAAPGVYQIKLPHVIDYPTGKSAMIRYGAADDVRAALVALGTAHPGAPWLARHLEDAAAAGDPAAFVADLLATFRRRFGAEPTVPAGSP